MGQTSAKMGTQQQGKFYRPVKKTVSLRLDADGTGYQTRANRVLRERMLKDRAGQGSRLA